MKRFPLAGFLALWAGCGSGGDSPPSSSAPTLTYESTLTMNVGTHRPEILLGDGGDVWVVVVEPDGPSGTVGTVKHKAYRFGSDLRAKAAPFAVSRIDATYGEPADHRAAWVNGELVVVYQSLKWKGAAPTGGGPAEDYASDQSLMLARFSPDGTEILRTPIVAHVTDFSQDNFPDHCLLWSGGRLLVGTGSNGSTLKIREVTLEGTVVATHSYWTSTTAVLGTIGNSLFEREGTVTMATGSQTELALCSIDGAFQATQLARFSEAGSDWTFPTGSLAANGTTFVAHLTRPSGKSDLETNPFSPVLKILDRTLAVVSEVEIGQNGFSHVHPTVALAGDRLLVAWSKRSGNAPQVNVEVFSVTSP